MTKIPLSAVALTVLLLAGCGAVPAPTATAVANEANRPSTSNETPATEPATDTTAPDAAQTTTTEAPVAEGNEAPISEGAPAGEGIPPVEGEPIETESGLRYIELTPGTGETAAAGKVAVVHYTGWLESSGQEFDSSLNRGEPFAFPLGDQQVIPGWDEGVQGMKVGGKRRLIIPADLGYGAQGAGGVIPPNATLVFDVELLELREGSPTAPSTVPEGGYQTTPTGLQYHDFEIGSGTEAISGTLVSVHYTGWLEDGTKFDSSIDRGEPIQLVLGQGMVIPGWDEGIQGMKVGGKRQLRIPADLGYGAQGAGGVIPPNATLIFDVELVDVTQQP